jgi:hypothetical protein
MVRVENLEKASKDVDRDMEDDSIEWLGIKVKVGDPHLNKPDLANYEFTCPVCKQKKNARQAVRVQTPIKMKEMQEQGNLSCTVSQKMLFCCQDCANKIIVPEHRLVKENEGT